MSTKIGKKVVVWLPDSVLAAIDSEREWRSRSEFIRNLLADHAKPKRAKPTASEPEKPREISDAEFWEAALATCDDRDYWRDAIAEHGSIAKLLKAMPANADIWRALEQ